MEADCNDRMEEEEEELPVHIEVCPLVLHPPQHITADLQDGELKPLAKLSWSLPRSGDGSSVSHTLTATLQSLSVASRFHVDFLGNLRQQSYSCLHRAASRLYDEGFLLTSVSLARDRLVIAISWDETQPRAKRSDVDVTKIWSVVKEELLPRWAWSSNEVRLNFLTQHTEPDLEKRLSNLEAMYNVSTEQTNNQLRTLENALERLATQVLASYGKVATSSPSQQEPESVFPPSKGPGSLQRSLNTNPQSQAVMQHRVEVPTELLHLENRRREGFKGDDEFPDGDGDGESGIGSMSRRSSISSLASVTSDVKSECRGIKVKGESLNTPDFLGGHFRPGNCDAVVAAVDMDYDPTRQQQLQYGISNEEIILQMLGERTEYLGVKKPPNWNGSQEETASELERLSQKLEIPDSSLKHDRAGDDPNTDFTGYHLKPELFLPGVRIRAQEEDSTGANGDAQTSATIDQSAPVEAYTQSAASTTGNPGLGQQAVTRLVQPPPMSQSEHTTVSSQSSTESQAYNDTRWQDASAQSHSDRVTRASQPPSPSPARSSPHLPPVPQDLPPEMDQLRAAGTDSNGAKSVHHNHNDLSSGPSINNHSPRVLHYEIDNNAQQRTNDPDANGGKQGLNMNQSGQDQLPKSHAKAPNKDPRPYGYPSDGTHYKRQSRTRMVERLEWATTMAAIEETPSPRARRGMDTVLCLDNSLSMHENGAFQEMKKVALDFIEGLEEMVENDLEENVAVVSMGGGARVLQHLTNDYSLVRSAIESLEPMGWTPYFETLLVAMQCLNRRGKVITMGRRHRIPARILCLTDGNPSDETSVPLEGQDPTMSDTSFRIMFVKRMPEMKAHTHDICWVPVGQNANKQMLQILEKLKVGTMVEPEHRGRLHRHFFTQNLLGQMLHCKSRIAEGNVGKEKQSQDAGDTDNPDISEYEPLFMALATNVTEEDKEEVRRCLKVILSKPQETTLEAEEGDFTSAHVDPSKLPLGTRVVRGPDWRCGEQDGGMPGTVVKHRRRDGKIEVEWDHGGREPYRYEQGGVMQVIEAPAATPPVLLEDRMIFVGANVQRGPDWSSGNEDGGPDAVGVVIGCKDDGRVKVVWKNGNVSVYNFGMHDLYEVFIRHDAHVQAEFGSHVSGSNMYGYRHHEGTSRAAQPRPLDGVTVWQWQDDQGQWILYNKENQDKLNKAFTRKPKGSCLVSRGNQNYRVLFADNVERCIQDMTTRRIMKIVVANLNDIQWPSDDHSTSPSSAADQSIVQREFDASSDIPPDLLEKARQKLTCPEGVNITPDDLKTLESNKWLDDTIIHAFLGVVAQQHGAVVLPGFLAVKLEAQQKLEPDWFRPQVKLSATNWILLPVYTSSHWLLLVMDVKKKLVHVLDSLPRQDRRDKCFHLWMTFLQGRAKVKAETDLPLAGWQVGQLTSKRQEGSGDCGVYVCMNGESMLEHGRPAQDVQMPVARRHIYCTVVTHGRPVTSSAL